MRNASHRFVAFGLLALVGPMVIACNGASSKSSDDTGSVQMALSVAPGTVVNTIAYSITGPGSFTRSGAIDVSQSSTISADISPLPVGTGFSIALGATSVDGATMCMGSATFDVSAHATTSVLVHLLCRTPSQNGSVMFNGALNICPLIDSLGASPGEAFVGGTIALSAQAHDTDAGPSALTYQWTTTAGTLSSSSAQNPTLTCTSAGVATVTLTVSDGDNDPGCPDTQSSTVTCTPTGAGGAGGAGGA